MDVTVNTAVAEPQLMVAVPEEVPARTVEPSKSATVVLLLEQDPSNAPLGSAVIVDVPPMEIEEGVKVMPVSGAAGVTLVEAPDAAPVPPLFVAVTLQV